MLHTSHQLHCLVLLCMSPQGNIAKWCKEVGDELKAGEVLCEIETVRIHIREGEEEA